MSESIATTDIRASEEGRDAAESQEPQQGYSEDQEIFSEGVSGPTVAGMVVSGSSLVSAEEDKAGDNKNISSTTPLSDGNNAPDSSRIGSPYIRFGGYVDEQGVVHDHEEADNSSPNDQEIKVQITPKDNGEEDGEDANTSTVEEVLEASQNFALSHPGRRFSSSLENLYSSSQRQLYPSLEDANDIPDLSPSKLPKSQQQKERKAPEPPATDDEEEEEEEEEDVKIGVASSSSEQFTPAYAYASATASEETNNFDGPMHAYASAAESESSPVYAVASLGDISTSTTEATVLETARTPEEVLLEKLEKEDAELAAMKRAAYYGESNRCGCSATTTASSFSAQHPSATNVADERATVVEITEHFVHPSDISNDAVTAELIGEDYNNVSSIGASRQVATPQQTTATGQAVMTVDDSIVNTSEATIIEQQTDWHPPHTEEAVVINGDTSSDAYLERKPAATPTNNASYEWGYPQNVVPTDSVVEDRSATSDNGEARVAFADEVGEIVGISEEFHPDEVPDDEAEAELVGEDYSCAVAVPQMGARETMSSVQSTNNEVQTAMVVGYEDNEGAIDGEIPTARAFSYSSPSAAEPMTPPSRAYSAPSTRQRDQGEGTDNAHITQEAVSEPTAATDEDWMRAPSLGGSSSDQGVTIMQPPNAEENTAVHVATLPAAAPSPSAGANANSCFVEDPANPPSQPEIPVASLNAFASAPFQPEADETDCHAMAMLRQQHSSMDATSEGSSITEPVDIPPPRSFNSTIGASEGVAGSGSVCSSTSNRLQTKVSCTLAALAKG